MYWWWLYTDVHRAGWLSWRCPTKLSLGHVGMIIYMQCVTSCVIDVVNAWTPGMCKKLGHVSFSKMQKMGFPWIELLPPGWSHWSLLKSLKSLSWGNETILTQPSQTDTVGTRLFPPHWAIGGHGGHILRRNSAFPLGMISMSFSNQSN